MGLDNGIIVYHKDGKEEEICYWRKCWGIRNAILNAVGSTTEFYTNLTIEDVQSIVEILVLFDDPKFWAENADSIWCYEDIQLNHQKHIAQLLKLIETMKGENDIEKVEFYDSY